MANNIPNRIDLFELVAIKIANFSSPSLAIRWAGRKKSPRNIDILRPLSISTNLFNKRSLEQ